MKTAFDIIPADFLRKEHRAALIALVDEYRRGPAGDGLPLGRNARRRLAAGIARHPSARVYFAADGRKLAGLAVCFIGYSTFRARNIVNIHDLIVTKKYRGKGAARALLAYVARTAARKGWCRITLEVRRDNTGARRLYRNAGFTGGRHPMYFLTKEIR